MYRQVCLYTGGRGSGQTGLSVYWWQRLRSDESVCILVAEAQVRQVCLYTGGRGSGQTGLSVYWWQRLRSDRSVCILVAEAAVDNDLSFRIT
jgi:hypothetical protein